MVVAQGPLQEVPYPDGLDYTKQSIEVPGTRKPGQTGHMRNGVWGFLDLDSPNIFTTLPQIFDAGFAKSADDPFTGHRPISSTNPLTYAKHYTWETYRQVDEHRRDIGSALHKMFREGRIGGGELETVGIWSQNRPEWQHIDLALQAYGKVGVSLYDTLGADAVEYIIRHAHLSIIFAASSHLATLVALAPRLPMMRVIVSIDDLSAQTKHVLQMWAKQSKIHIMELSEVKALGKAHRIDLIPATPDQISSICYTSGTTSTPKGVILTHGAMAASTSSFIHGAKLGEDGVLLSYLPLAHIYERIGELLVIAGGGRIGYFTGDPLRLLEDAQILRPTYFPSVPRVLNRIYQGAMLAGNVPGLRGNIFRKACEVKLKNLRETGAYTHVLWDKLVFRKVQAVLGGRIRDITSGSAPISRDVMEFLRIAFACDVLEGYGLTESCAAATRVWCDDPQSPGTVGGPMPTCELKLVDIPSMSYFADDKPHPRGEMCIRGPCILTTYFKDPKSTADALDEEGWFHTGDVAEIDTCGRFKIIDRIKNIMKLSQGEYVALEKIENIYNASPLVEQIYIHGDSLQSYLLAVVIPEPNAFATMASKILGKTLDAGSLAEAAQDERVVEKVLAHLTSEADKAGMKGFEKVKRIHISLDPFSVENGLLTPTFKVKRKAASEKYQKQLVDLYALGPIGNSDAFKL